LSRLFLITPRQIDLATFPATLEAALAAGDVASLLIAPEDVSDMVLQRIAEVLTPIGQQYGAAVLVRDDTRAAGRAKADGIHVETGPADLRAACLSFQPNRIVGAGALKTRDDAMAAGETGADYVFFGMLGAAEAPEPHPRSLDLTDWWVPLFEIPCVCLAGSDLASVDRVAAAGADFVALRDAVWADPRGPAAAVADACRRLEAAAAEA
jgi:thiamine-phosphate pyrophosphorylase